MKYQLLAIAILIAALMAGPAYAISEKGPRCNDGLDNDGDSLIDGEDPDCGGDGGPPPIVGNLVVKDFTGKILGPVFPTSFGNNDFVSFISTPVGPARARVFPTFGLVGFGSLSWDSPNCTGNSYVEFPIGEEANPPGETFLLIARGGFGGEFWVPDITQSIQSVQILSETQTTGACVARDELQDVLPPIPVTVDYTTPLTMEVN